MNKFRVSIFIVCLIGVSIASTLLYNQESKKRTLQAELIELSMVKYGIFSVDEWEQRLSDIIVKRLNEFKLEENKESELRVSIEDFLHQAIDKLEESFNDRNSGSIGGVFKRGVANLTDVFGVMREDIPLITESILAFIKDPQNKELARDFLLKKLDEYSEETFSEIDYTVYNNILEKHDAENKNEARETISDKITALEKKQAPFIYSVFGLGLLAFVTIMFSTSFVNIEFIMLTFLCAVFLAVGLLLPMINIDARISSMEIMLMGESIVFTDQILYFKSKSILEVVSVMLQDGNADVMAVGILVFSFSVLFPVSKLSTSLLYVYFENLRSNAVIKFLVFKTAKWSMADVMVVAIFMAYIGFSGIISSQLQDLENITDYVELVTTNASSLQIGFYLFTTFAVLSLLVSHKMQYSKK
ncbi:MAG: paraquat-inducible protein A [Balneolaceae bacterium]|nr:paraquat-inducible protein A [Balneolaceae bacterium]